MTVLLPRSSEVILDTGLQYYVRNNTDTALTLPDNRTPLLRYNKVAYRCDPGEKAIVPWPVIALYFGDPRSQHDKIVEAEDSQGKHRVPSRGAELLRLSVFYGTYEHNLDVLSQVVPDVTITTLDGVEIVPPVFDPDGDYVYGYQRSMQKSTDVATLIDDMQNQIDALKAAQAMRQIHGDNDGELPEDNPRMP